MLRRSADAGQVPPTLRVSIETSLSEIARLETAVTRILQLGGPERTWREPCSLHELIAGAADLVQTGFAKSGIALRLELDAESDRISADRTSMKGVFLSLLVNARDAMQGRGEISVETQLFLDENGRQMVAAAVSDSGPGVPFALRDEIFHPFFTTKRDGCGIGLPASLKALREHDGDLYLSERPDGGRGACFVLLFPLTIPNGADEVVRPHVGPTSTVPKGGWRRPSATSLPWRRVSQLPATSEIDDRGEATTPGVLH
jgi:signal transduction histidine kinase